MLVLESLRRHVAYFSRTEVLDRAGEYILGVESPVVAFSGEALEGSAFEAYECLLDHGFHFTVAAFHVEHHRDWNTTCEPLNRGFGQVAEARHVAGHSGVDQHGCIVAESVAIVGVEV